VDVYNRKAKLHDSGGCKFRKEMSNLTIPLVQMFAKIILSNEEKVLKKYILPSSEGRKKSQYEKIIVTIEKYIE
jgi:hypothetical protein